MKAIKVAVLMGGRSPEHEVSISSGEEVLKNFPKQYVPIPVVISKDGKSWKMRSKRGFKLANPFLIRKYADLCFIAMHGPFGEDGTIQGMLEMVGIPYTGSGVLASSLGMDKIAFRKLMAFEKVPIPNYIILEKGQKLKIPKDLGGFPYCIKPCDQGSSVGVSIVRNRKDMKRALDAAFKFGDKVLIDEYIKGVELTCAVLGNEDALALPLVEIVPLKGEFFDYDSKYSEGGAEEISPARISDRLTNKTQRLAVDIYKSLGCRGFARVDFILRGDEPIVLEVNTIPGLTPTSLFPKAAMAAGISYKQLLDKIIKYASE